MSWIKTIPFSEAAGRLLKLYKRVSGPDNNVDNIMLSHSLRPHTMEGHMVLYKNVLHHAGNTIPKWFAETIGVYVSLLNECDYCVDHHFAGLCRLLDESRGGEIREALESHVFSIFDPKHDAALMYAGRLTIHPSEVVENEIEMMRSAGWTDGEILEINQVAAYFNYANRTVLGLGINTEGDIIGLSPNSSDDPNNWNHQ